jgi:hypothetical protein
VSTAALSAKSTPLDDDSGAIDEIDPRRSVSTAALSAKSALPADDSGAIDEIDARRSVSTAALSAKSALLADESGAIGGGGTPGGAVVSGGVAGRHRKATGPMRRQRARRPDGGSG